MRTGNVIELSHAEICHAMHLRGDLPPYEMGVRYAEVYDKLQERVTAGEIEHEKRGRKSIYRMRLGNGPLPKRFDPNAVVLATGKANPFRKGRARTSGSGVSDERPDSASDLGQCLFVPRNAGQHEGKRADHHRLNTAGQRDNMLPHSVHIEHSPACTAQHDGE